MGDESQQRSHGSRLPATEFRYGRGLRVGDQDVGKQNANERSAIQDSLAGANYDSADGRDDAADVSADQFGAAVSSRLYNQGRSSQGRFPFEVQRRRRFQVRWTANASGRTRRGRRRD